MKPLFIVSVALFALLILTEAASTGYCGAPVAEVMRPTPMAATA
jgi:hypothetical protein